MRVLGRLPAVVLASPWHPRVIPGLAKIGLGVKLLVCFSETAPTDSPGNHIVHWLPPRLREDTVCRWHECRGCEHTEEEHGREAALLALRDSKLDQAAMEDLRHLALRYDDERLLVRATDEEVCARVAGLIASGYLRLCGTKTQVYRDEGVPLVKAPPVPKPARRWLEPPPPAPPAPIEDSTFTPNLDAAALAKVLKDAARAGVPFCEECEKARRTQQRTADTVA